MENWQQAAEQRTNTYKWTDEIPSEADINEILDNLHLYSPSKQRKVRYEILIYRNDDELRRKQIYRASAADLTDTARHNPQTLAPWLLLFKKRNSDEDFNDADIFMDLGIATGAIIWAAADKGIDSGLNKCVNYPDLVEDAVGFMPEMIIGLGYKAPGQSYYCTHYEKEVSIPDSNYDQKPNKDDYISYWSHNE